MPVDYPYQSDFARRHFDAGLAAGRAKVILIVLDARAIAVPDSVRDVIANCTDVDQLKTWVNRAATANTIEDLEIPVAG